MRPPRRLVIIGTGLIGTSIGLAARVGGVDVHLFDRNPEHLRQAEQMGAGTAEPRDFATVASDLVPVDLVVIAVPPSAVPSVAAQALRAFPEATVTDVSSVKTTVVSRLRDAGVDLRRFVPGHPMAGREISGPSAATADLFYGRPWLLTPTLEADPVRLGLVADWVGLTGAVVRHMPAELHDQAVALTSHTPQLVASAMAAQLQHAPEQLLGVAGQGLRDVIRIAASDPQLWADIVTSNAAEVAPVLQSVAAELLHVAQQLTAAASVESRQLAVANLVGSGQVGCARLPAKHGGVGPAFVAVPVEVADTPGALGEVFATAGRAGINLEDVRIEHTVGRLTAIAHLYVLPEVVPELAEVMHEKGWRVLE